jgi:phosphoserine phosphatase
MPAHPGLAAPVADTPGATRRQLAPGLVVQGIATPQRLADYRLIAFDMDSTLIDIECVDEIAALAGCQAQVAALTEATMRGEITDFKDSLRRRVALLAGVPEAAVHALFGRRVRFNPGVERLVAAARDAGLHTVLVSGGFTHIADRVRAHLGLDEARSNVLEIADGHLTGRLVPQAWGDIVDGEEKRRVLLATCARLGVGPGRAIAVGDGANDLPMMQAAGLSVAFHAKPLVRAAAHVSIESGGMDRLLEWVAP